MDVRDQDTALLLQAILEELLRQTELLEAMLRKLDAIERTQYS
jgi:CCR4-NOT transcriptional regulation complex NOT5 subunit